MAREFDPFAQRDILVLAQRQNAAVEIQPAQFTVDKDRFVTHNNNLRISSLTKAAAGCALFRYTLTAYASLPMNPPLLG